MKQVQANPWDKVAEKYPPGTMIKGTVRNLTNYGAFIEIEEGIDGLLHVCDMSWTARSATRARSLKKGEKVTCVVLNVDQETQADRPGPQADARTTRGRPTSPAATSPGEVVKGKVTKLTNFGVFVELEPGLEGLLHISELADHKVESPEDVVKVGDEIEVKILRVDRDERKIGLSRKNLHDRTCRRSESRGRTAAGRRRLRPKAKAEARAARRHRPAAARCSSMPEPERVRSPELSRVARLRRHRRKARNSASSAVSTH